MRYPLSILLAAVVCAPAAAQKICMDVNTNQNLTQTLVTRAPAWVVGKYTATQALNNVSGLELVLASSIAGVSVQVAIFDVDPATGAPGVQLCSGTAIANPEQRTYSAGLTPAAAIANGAEFFIGAEVGPLSSGTARIAYDATGAGVSGDIYAGAPGAWSLFQNAAIAFRVYCDWHGGVTANFGQGKVGSGSVAPSLYGIGFPNLGNPLSLQIVDAAPGQPAVLSIGLPNSTPVPPLGTLYTDPTIVTLTGTTSMPANGYLSFEIPVPNDMRISGIVLAWQGWIADASAAAGIAHTDAVRTTIGL